jgi:RNA polymerase sigma factor (sigma-70 family)
LVDQELISRCISEEPKAQYEMYKALYSLMMSVCSRYERNKQDAVAKMNEGFLKVLTHLQDRKENVPFELWVRRIMINTVIDEHRKDKSRKSIEVLKDDIDGAVEESVNEYLKDMESEQFEMMMMRLPEMTGRVFNLFAIDGYSHAEISEMLGMSEGTSRWHVAQARKELQDAILKEAKKSMIQTQ